jgi:hypothetical protein
VVLWLLRDGREPVVESQDRDAPNGERMVGSEGALVTDVDAKLLGEWHASHPCTRSVAHYQVCTVVAVVGDGRGEMSAPSRSTDGRGNTVMLPFGSGNATRMLVCADSGRRVAL